MRESWPFRPRFLGFLGGSAAWHPGFALCGRTSPLKPYEALEVIDTVRHADLDPGPGDADVVFVAEHWDREIDRLKRLRIATLPSLRLGAFNRPARIAVLLTDLGRLLLHELLAEQSYRYRTGHLAVEPQP